MAYATGRIAGTFEHPDGTPWVGKHVYLTPSAPAIQDPDGSTIISGGLRARTDETGSVSFTVPASDDPSLDPTGVRYAVRVSIDGVQPVTDIFVATDAVVQLSDVIPRVPGAPVYAEQVTRTEFDALLARIAQLEDGLPTTPTVTYPGPGQFPGSNVYPIGA